MPLHKALTWSHLEAFSQDSSLVREMRDEYFRRHCPNLNTEDTHDLWDVFQHMARSNELLGSAIYEIKEVWKGLVGLWQANYTLKTLPKGLKFLSVVPPSESPKVMGLIGIHDLNVPHWFNGVTLCPCVRRSAKNRAQSSITSGQCIIGSALCTRNVSAAHPPCWKPSAVMARRTTNPQGREAPMSHPHQCNCQQEVYKVNLS